MVIFLSFPFSDFVTKTPISITWMEPDAHVIIIFIFIIIVNIVDIHFLCLLLFLDTTSITEVSVDLVVVERPASIRTNNGG